MVGVAAVYVSGGFEGNIAVSPPRQSVSSPAADAPEDSACAASNIVSVAGKATGQVAAMAPADPPRSLKTLAFNGPDGKPMTLADRSGKTVLMNLWATWCAPCRAEMPELDLLQKEKGSDAFEVIAINVDTGDDAKPRKFLEETGVSSLGYYRENTLTLFNSLKKQGLALGLPVTLLIDGKGCLLASMNGPAAWASADAKALIDSATAP